MKKFEVRPIGMVRHDKGETMLVLDHAYAGALQGLDGFSHIQLLWWFSQCEDEKYRRMVEEASPYKGGPEALGTFATRSPMRPNPVALSTVQVTRIDIENARIGVAYVDADDLSPILDIKPYTPSLDRVQGPVTPGWCRHWPDSLEQSANFDWAGEFNF